MKHPTPAALSAALATTVAAALLTPSTAFLPPQHFHRTTTLSSFTQLSATPSSAVSTFSTSQATTISTIASAIPDLAPKPSLSLDGTTLIAGSPTTLDARDAPGPANVAWLAGVTVADKMSSLTIFNGPLTDVPHLLSRAVADGTSLTLDLDFRPRAYGAYELKDDQGNYPGPETFGRQAFEYSGNRKDFETKYGTDEVASFLAATAASLEGAVPSPRTPSEFDKLTNGPLVLSLTMPLTDGNVAAVDSARAQAASFWLRWATEGGHEHRPGAPINSQYVYDTKYRQNAYSGLLGVYEGIFGAADGAVLAAKESGPLDEAYVGGGS